MLILGAAFFAMFYYLTYYIQGVLGFSSLKSGLAYLPFSAIIIVGSGIVSQILPRVGAKALLIAGSVLMSAGLFLFAQVHTDTKYASGILPAMIVMATGVALVFVTLTVVAVTKVTDTDTGLASALLNVGQQIGGSIGLAVLATAFTSATKSEGTTQVRELSGPSRQHLIELLGSARTGKAASPSAYTDQIALHAFHAVQAHGSGQSFLVAGTFGIVAVVAALVLINVKKRDVAQATELAPGVA
jgi:hypothetical protein